ncbi:MAG TPA: hypothetical protein VHQ94_07425 [Pyrinomonadaceae bacterium]|nr:hypothetical protein [Pyrinomonadaceae bacterium]
MSNDCAAGVAAELDHHNGVATPQASLVKSAATAKLQVVHDECRPTLLNSREVLASEHLR